jgi:hypothetical protein
VNTELGFLSGSYLVKNQIKHKRNVQNTDRCWKIIIQKSILSESGIRLKKKKKTTSIKDSPDLNITNNFTCKYWAWNKDKNMSHLPPYK